MPRLGNVIAALLSDVAAARVQGDMETARIADAYQRDPLLRHLPVPRFRLPELVIDLPVLLAEARPEALDRPGPLSLRPTADELRQPLSQALEDAEVKLAPAAAQEAERAVAERMTAVFEGEHRALLTAGRISSEIAEAFADAVAGSGGKGLAERRSPLRQAAERRARAVISRKVDEALSVDVLVSASEIKAHDDSASTVRVRMTVSEDAYEVVATDDDAGYSLTPE